MHFNPKNYLEKIEPIRYVFLYLSYYFFLTTIIVDSRWPKGMSPLDFLGG